MRENVAAAATLTPEIAAKAALPRTVATARRAGTAFRPRFIRVKRSRAAPDAAMKLPITMNRGIVPKT